MTIDKLLELVAEALELEGELNLHDKIEDIEEWDSLGNMAVISMLDELGAGIDSEKIAEISTVKEFVDLVDLDGC